MQVVVDNSKGADVRFAADLGERLRAAGFEVESREPLPQSMFDTTVHFVVEGIAIRVPPDTGRAELSSVVAAVRAALAHRRERQRFRAVPVYRGDSNQVLTWVDVFASDPF